MRENRKYTYSGETVISDLTNGDINAFNYFFEKFYKSLVYYCYHIVQDEEEAKDIVLETFHKFWMKRTTFENFLNAKSFLYLVAKNASLDYLKQTKRKLTRFHDFSLTIDLVESDKNYLEIEALLLQRIYEEIKNLPEKCRKIFELSYFEEKTIDEISQELNISPSNVTSQRYRAIQLLKIALIDSPHALVYLLLLCSLK